MRAPSAGGEPPAAGGLPLPRLLPRLRARVRGRGPQAGRVCSCSDGHGFKLQTMSFPCLPLAYELGCAAGALPAGRVCSPSWMGMGLSFKPCHSRAYPSPTSSGSRQGTPDVSCLLLSWLDMGLNRGPTCAYPSPTSSGARQGPFRRAVFASFPGWTSVEKVPGWTWVPPVLLPRR